MALIDKPLREPHEEYSINITSEQANNWLNENIPFSISTFQKKKLTSRLKRKRSFEQDTPNKRQKISSSNGASSADPELENSGPEAGPSEEWDSKDKGVLKKKDFKRMHLKESEYHRAGYIAWNRNLKASLRPNRDGIEESRAGWGRSGMGGQR